MKTEEIEQKVADSNERLAQRKARQVPLAFPFTHKMAVSDAFWPYSN